MRLAVDITPFSLTGPKGRTILVVSLILLGLVAPSPFVSSVSGTVSTTSPVLAAWDPAAGVLAAIDIHKGNLRPIQLFAFLAVLPDPFPSSEVQTLIAHRLASPLTPARLGLTLPARVQADL